MIVGPTTKRRSSSSRSEEAGHEFEKSLFLSSSKIQTHNKKQQGNQSSFVRLPRSSTNFVSSHRRSGHQDIRSSLRSLAAQHINSVISTASHCGCGRQNSGSRRINLLSSIDRLGLGELSGFHCILSSPIILGIIGLEVTSGFPYTCCL